MTTATEFWKQFDCVDCGVNTSMPVGIREYYVLHHDVWDSTGLTRDGGMLCIGCVETRLGRELIGLDFMDCVANLDLNASERLRERRTRGGTSDDLRAIRTALRAFTDPDANLPLILEAVHDYLVERLTRMPSGATP